MESQSKPLGMMLSEGKVRTEHRKGETVTQKPDVSDTHGAEAAFVGFIQNDDAVLAEEGVSQDLPQEAPISHVPDYSVLQGSSRHSAASLAFCFTANTPTHITHLPRTPWLFTHHRCLAMLHLQGAPNKNFLKRVTGHKQLGQTTRQSSETAQVTVPTAPGQCPPRRCSRQSGPGSPRGPPGDSPSPRPPSVPPTRWPHAGAGSLRWHRAWPALWGTNKGLGRILKIISFHPTLSWDTLHRWLQVLSNLGHSQGRARFSGKTVPGPSHPHRE